MFHYLSQDLIIELIGFQAVMLIVVLSNAWLLHQTGRHRPPDRFPKVSILVPARNEERCIAACIRSLLSQDYPNFEVLALDDSSSDQTRAILEQLVCSQAHLKVLTGQPLPPGWLGKNWACAQLAAQAQGELLYFTDADTRHQPKALSTAVAALEGERADLLTGFPRQEMCGWGERLSVPFFGWACYCFTPLFLAYRVKLPVLSTAVGQMLLFRSSVYSAVGGHAAVRDCIVEDLALARRVKAGGHRWRVMDATLLVTCRMYCSGREAFAGLSKNLFAAFDFSLLPYLFAFFWLAVIFLEPLLLLVLYILRLAPAVQIAPLLSCIGLGLALWLLPYQRRGLGWSLALLYPLTLVVMESIALHSLLLTLSGRLTWKGRTLLHKQWKWL